MVSEMSLHDVVAGQPEPGGRRTVRAAEKRRRRRRRRSKWTVLLGVLVLGAAAAGAWLGLRPIVAGFMEPKDYPGPGTGSVIFKVDPGDSGVSIGRNLQKAGVVKTVQAFLDAEKADPVAAKHIQPGAYQMRLQMKASDAFTVLSDPAGRIFTKVTFREGLRVTQVVDLLVTKGGFDRAAVLAALKDPQALGLPADAGGKVEGYLFPATYEFEPGTTAAQALATMVTKSEQTLAGLGVPEAKWHEVLTKASIVQAEGGIEENFGKVARVIDNRLGRPMNLGMDSTVSYATSKFGITTTAAQRASTSPYNTYNHKGLPPGPIGNPGKAAMEAVLAPTPGSWLYFTTVNPQTGETKFAVTTAQKAVFDRQFQAWLRAHPQG